MENAVFERIDRLMKQQGKKQKELNDYLGLTHSAYDNWKSGRSKSYTKYISKICSFLDVTPSYLFSGTEVEEETSSITAMNLELQKEEELINLYRTVSHEMKEITLNMLRVYAMQMKNR